MAIEREKLDTQRIADYRNIPDHSDLRGFSYRAPQNFDYRDEQPSKPQGLWRNLLSYLGWEGRRHGP